MEPEVQFCLDLWKKNHMSPIYLDTNAGLILTVQLESTLFYDLLYAAISN